MMAMESDMSVFTKITTYDQPLASVQINESGTKEYFERLQSI